jgi:2-polyprenyl-3-methyl-5-hydroxy-6-metoxy-1,4-benzoquinol methylase
LRSLVTIPVLLEKRLARNPEKLSYRPKFSEELSTQTVRNTIRKARKTLNSLTGPNYLSRWSEYVETATHYSSADHSAKGEFVRKALITIRPEHVLDVGANTGTYSRIAVECGAQVVAWDTDVRAVDIHWKAARQDKLPILPIVADFARPTPALGWRNQEQAGLLARSSQRFDCVLMLGVLHHLMVADQIPLSEILEQLVMISRQWAILEWIPKEDSQFRELCRGREELYKHCDEAYFQRAVGDKFCIRLQQELPNGRTLVLIEKQR